MNTVTEFRRNMLTELRGQLNAMAPEFKSVLPAHIKPDHFVRVVLTAIQNDPELLECDRRSFFNACMRAATDGLIPDGRQGVIVTYRTTRGKIAQWQPMVQGILAKIRHSGEITSIDVEVVLEGDEYQYQRGDAPRIHHIPSSGVRGEVIAAYSVAHFRSGEISREWMWRSEIEKRRGVSRAKSGPWESWFEEMCKKTVLKRHAKILPTSAEIETVFQRDDQVDEEIAEEVTSEPNKPASLDSVLDQLAFGEGGEAEPPKDLATRRLEAEDQ